MADMVGIVPTGNVWGLILKDLMFELEAAFFKASRPIKCDVLLERPHPIPKLSYDSPLGRHRTTSFLSLGRSLKIKVENEHDVKIEKILVLTDVEISDPPEMNLFGQAEREDTCCVVSLHRLQRGANRFLLKERLVKECLHELGHTYGLRHCFNRKCPMNFSNIPREIDEKGKEFCKSCAPLLLDDGKGDYWGF